MKIFKVQSPAMINFYLDRNRITNEIIKVNDMIYLYDDVEVIFSKRVMKSRVICQKKLMIGDSLILQISNVFYYTNIKPQSITINISKKYLLKLIWEVLIV